MFNRLLTATLILLAAAAAWGASAAVPPAPRLPESFRASTTGLEYIDTNFENASPLWYQFAPDPTIALHLLYDHERNSPNRASGHVHFLNHAKPGAQLTFEFKNLENYWNGKPGLFARHFRSVVVSEDGRTWRDLALENVSVVHEFASNWLAGVNDFPSGRHWENYGEHLATVLHEYFGAWPP